MYPQVGTDSRYSRALGLGFRVEGNFTEGCENTGVVRSFAGTWAQAPQANHTTGHGHSGCPNRRCFRDSCRTEQLSLRGYRFSSGRLYNARFERWNRGCFRRIPPALECSHGWQALGIQGAFRLLTPWRGQNGTGPCISMYCL